MWRDHSLFVTNKHTTENYSNTEGKIETTRTSEERQRSERERTENTHVYIYGNIYIYVIAWPMPRCSKPRSCWSWKINICR